jgi:hypothetical protein
LIRARSSPSGSFLSVIVPSVVSSLDIFVKERPFRASSFFPRAPCKVAATVCRLLRRVVLPTIFYFFVGLSSRRSSSSSCTAGAPGSSVGELSVNTTVSASPLPHIAASSSRLAACCSSGISAGSLSSPTRRIHRRSCRDLFSVAVLLRHSSNGDWFFHKSDSLLPSCMCSRSFVCRSCISR